MKFKIVLSFLIFLVVISLTSCSGIDFGGDDDNFDISKFKKGFSELELGLDTKQGDQEEKNDVDKLVGFQKEPLDFYINLYNKMGYEISDVEVSVSSFDFSIVEMEKNVGTTSIIEGMDPYTEVGGWEEFFFNGQIKEVPEFDYIKENVKIKSQNFRIYVSYKSKIEFSNDQICIENGNYAFEGGCEPKEITLSGKDAGQGAPLAVVKIWKPEIKTGSILYLVFELENKNNKGTVGSISLSKAKLVNDDLNCKFRKGNTDLGTSIKLKKDESKATLVCTKILNENFAPQRKTVVLEFLYDYRFNVEKELEIKG